MNVRAKVTVTAVAALAALAGCSSGDSSSKPAAPSTPTVKLPHDGAPKVTDPIADTSKLSADPCSVLTASDKKAAGIATGQPHLKQMDGDSCQFAAGGSKFGTLHAVLIDPKGGPPLEGLSTTYANAKADGKTLKTVGPYEGHPAVERTDKGDPHLCDVVIGLSDQLAYGVSVDDDDHSFGSGTPCQEAEKFATTIMKNIKQGG